MRLQRGEGCVTCNCSCDANAGTCTSSSFEEAQVAASGEGASCNDSCSGTQAGLEGRGGGVRGQSWLKKTAIR